MLTKSIVIISQYTIKPLCCIPETYTVMYVNYFSIKLEKKKKTRKKLFKKKEYVLISTTTKRKHTPNQTF